MVSLDDTLLGLEEKAPSILAMGLSLEEISDIKVVIEKENVLSMPTMLKALHFCFASYYVFNISFPSPFKPTLLFLEKYVYGLPSSQKLPMSIMLLYDNMQRVLPSASE